MLQTILTTAINLPREYPRRMRLWFFLVSSVVLILSIQTFLPTWDILPSALGDTAPMMILAIFLLALLCEYMDSSLGMGYGTTLTPVLLLMGYEPLQVVPAVLFSELITGVLAGFMHQKDGNVDYLNDKRVLRTVLLLSVLSALGALMAVWIAISISKLMLGMFITTIVIAMGVVILASRNRHLVYRSGSILIIGAIASFNKGLSGGGYGPLVTAGQVVSGLPAKHAVAVTSVAESLTCAIGVLAYLALGKSIDWSLALPLLSGAVLSVPLATITVHHISEKTMRTLVGVATLSLGVWALCKLML